MCNVIVSRVGNKRQCDRRLDQLLPLPTALGARLKNTEQAQALAAWPLQAPLDYYDEDFAPEAALPIYMRDKVAVTLEE